MPFAGGNYTTPVNSWSPAVTGTTINASDWETLRSDLQTALSTCVLKDGSQVITANLPMNSNKLTGLSAGSASGESLRYEQVNGVVTTLGDILVASGSGSFGRLGIGAAGTVPMARTAASQGLAYAAALNSSIYGFTYTTDSLQGITVSSGGAMDATGAYYIVGASLIKKADTAWAVGTNQGSLDTGAIGNNDYYIWAIVRSDTGVVDYLTSLSSTAPTMPASYDFKRLIGWFKRVGGTIAAFHTYETEGGGIEMNWDVPTLDINLANTLTTARRTDAVKTPQNFSTLAHLRIEINDSAAGSNNIICCPDETDAAPNTTSAPLVTIQSVISARSFIDAFIRTSSTGTIAARSDIATVDLYAVVTIGFKWARRN